MDFLDALDFGFGDPFVPFANTARFEGHRFLDDRLERRERPLPVLEPVQPNPWTSDESSEEEEPFMPDSFDFIDAVSSAFGPDGQGSNQFDYRVYDRIPATNPPLTKMILLAPNEDVIVVVPRCFPRKRITRACVELAISQWMKHQQSLPRGAPGRIEIETHHVEFDVDGEILRAPVLMWKGMEQLPDMPDTFRFFA